MNTKRIFKAISIIFIVATIFFTNSCNSNDITVKNKIEILLSIDTSKERINITYLLPATQEDSLIFRLILQAPGMYYPMKLQQIENFEAFDHANNLLPVYVDSTEFIIMQTQNLKKISYSIQKNEINADNFISDGIIISDEIIAINGGASIGYIEQLRNLPISVSYLCTDKKKCISGNYQVVNDSVFIFDFENYEELIDNPIIFSSIADSASFQVNNNIISVFTHSPNNIVTSENMVRIIKPTIETVWEKLSFLPIKDHRFIFVFNKKMMGKKLDFLAMEYKKNTVYYIFLEPYLSDSTDRLQFEFVTKMLTAHELFHLFTPISFADNFLQSYQFYDFKMSKHLWLYEGFVTCFSLKILYKNGIITQNEFFVEMSRKLRNFEEMTQNMHYFEKSEQKVSLTELSENIYNDLKLFPIFYSKGALISFLLDIEIIDKTNGKRDLFDILKQIYAQTPIFDPDSLIYNIVKLSNPSVDDFFNSYIIGKNSLDFDKYLQKAGMKIKEGKNAERWYYLFPIREFEFDDIQKTLSVTFWKKLNGIEQKTIIITKINDLPINSYTAGLLLSERFDKPREIRITYLENDLEKEITISQQRAIFGFKKIDVKEDLTEKEKMVYDRLFKK